MISLTFLGAAQTVSGSKCPLEANQRRIMVDCGVFQGIKELRRSNRRPLPIDPTIIISTCSVVTGERILIRADNDF